MDAVFHNLLLGFQVALAPKMLAYGFIGCLVGTLVGVLPGIGPVGAVSLLLPVTFGLDPTGALILMAGIYYGAMYGGSTTSILMRIPGEAASVMTCLDGYAMARQGRAGAALGISAFGSYIAGTAGVIGLMLVAPPLARFALRFGPPESFALLALALVALGYMNSGSTAKALAMMIAGLMLGMIGIDPITGYYRFTFGISALADGIGIVPVAVGLFGVAEVLASAAQATPPDVIRAPKLRDLFPSRAEWRASAAPIGRGTVLGFLIGVLPGPGHIISTFVSYAVERKMSKRPERFGHGAIEGVAGPESANNAATCGALIPMLSLGLPSSPTIAVIIAGLMIHGLTPGPLLAREHPDLFWGFIASMYIGNVMLLIMNLPLVGLFVNVLRVPYGILYPIILMFCVLGVYADNHSVVDVGIMIVMGVAGYALRAFGFEPAPVIVGVVLAPMVELAFRQSLTLSGGDYAIFVTRPIAAVLLAAAAIVLASAAISGIRGATRAGTARAPVEEPHA